jgi:hypothetical protein
MNALNDLVNNLGNGMIPKGTIVTPKGGKHKRVAQIDEALKGMDDLIRGASIGSSKEFLNPEQYAESIESLAEYEQTVNLSARALGMLARGSTGQKRKIIGTRLESEQSYGTRLAQVEKKRGNRSSLSWLRSPTPVRKEFDVYEPAQRFDGIWPDNRSLRRGKKKLNRHGLTKLPHDAKIQKLKGLIRDAKKPADRALNRWKRENQDTSKRLNDGFDRSDSNLNRAANVFWKLEGASGAQSDPNSNYQGVYNLLEQGLTRFDGSDNWINAAARELDVKPDVRVVVGKIQHLEHDARYDLNSAGTELVYAKQGFDRERESVFLTEDNLGVLGSRREGLETSIKSFGASVDFVSGRVELPGNTMFGDGITPHTSEKEELFRVIDALPRLESTANQVSRYETQLSSVVDGIESERFDLPTGMSGDIYGAIESARELLPAKGFDGLREHYARKLSVEDVKGAEELVKEAYGAACEDLSRRARGFIKRTSFDETALHSSMEDVRELNSTIRKAREFSLGGVVNSRDVITDDNYSRLQALEQSLKEVHSYSEKLGSAKESILKRSFKSPINFQGPYDGDISVPEIVEVERSMQRNYVSASKGLANAATALSQKVIETEGVLYSTISEVTESIRSLRAAQRFSAPGVVESRPDLVDSALDDLTKYESVLREAKSAYEDMKRSASSSHQVNGLVGDLNYYLDKAMREAERWGTDDIDTRNATTSVRSIYNELVGILGDQAQTVSLAEQPAKKSYDSRVASLFGSEDSGTSASTVDSLIDTEKLNAYRSNLLPALTRYESENENRPRRHSFWD